MLVLEVTTRTTGDVRFFEVPVDKESNVQAMDRVNCGCRAYANEFAWRYAEVHGMLSEWKVLVGGIPADAKVIKMGV